MGGAGMTQLYSVNALANEFGLDRRTVERRLREVPPAQTTEREGRSERRWYLKDVLPYLAADNKAATQDVDAGELVQLMIGEALFPRLLASSELRTTITGFARRELKLSKPQAILLYQVVAIGIAESLAAAFPNHQLRFAVPAPLSSISELGAEAWCERYWPEEV